MPIIGITPEDELVETQRKKRITLLTLILILAILVMGGIWYWFYYQESNLKNQVASLDKKAQDLDKQIGEKKTVKEEASTLITQLSNLDSLIKNHIYWSKTFSEIETNTLKKAYFTRFTGDAAGKKIVLSCQVPDFEQAAKQIVVLRQGKKFTKVDISGISINVAEGKSYIGFDATLTLADDLLMPNLK